MENKKELFIKYLDINAQKCSEEISKNILPVFQETLNKAIQLSYREGFSKALKLFNEKNNKDKNNKK